MTKQTILFLAANPVGSSPLALDREAHAIQVELERSGHRDQFEFVTRWAVEPMDLLRELRKLHPAVVHFSGHGHGPPSPSNRAGRDVGPSTATVGSSAGSGLYFHASDGTARLVSAAAIQQTFGAAGDTVRLVVLNACYSAAQAEALLVHVDCVIGMSGAIGDDAARAFAVGLYGGLSEREAVTAAYRQGRAAIALEGLPDGERLKLRVRAGVDAARLVLAAGVA